MNKKYSYFSTIIILIYVVFTIQKDLLFFSVNNIFLNPIYIITKVIVVLLLFKIADFLKYLFSNLVKKDKGTMIFISYFLAFLTISLLVAKFILLPDLVSDCEKILYCAKNLIVLSPQLRCFSNLFYIFSFEILPCKLSPIWCQIVLISFLIAKMYQKLYEFFNVKLLLLLTIPFLIPAHLFLNCLAYRTVLLAYFFLYLCLLLFIKFYKQENFNKKEILFYSCFISFLSSIRHETVIFSLLFPIIFLIIFKKNLTKKNIIMYLVLSCFFSLIFNFDFLFVNNCYYFDLIFSFIRTTNDAERYSHSIGIIDNYFNLVSNKDYFYKQIYKFYNICLSSEFPCMWDGCFNLEIMEKIEREIIRKNLILKYINTNVFIPLLLNTILFIVGLIKKNKFMICFPILIYSNIIIVILFMTGIAYYYHSVSTIVPYLIVPSVLLSYTKYNKLNRQFFD